jgi:hypothetical protein
MASRSSKRQRGGEPVVAAEEEPAVQAAPEKRSVRKRKESALVVASRSLELKRRTLPLDSDQTTLAGWMRGGRSVPASAGARRELWRQITCPRGGDHDFGCLLQRPDVAVLAARLQALNDVQLQSCLEMLARELLPCRQGIVADFSPILAGCTRGNAKTDTMGAGAGSKSAAMYQIKYMGKGTVESRGDRTSRPAASCAMAAYGIGGGGEVDASRGP